METQSPISPRVIYYYVNTRRWLSDLEFFQVEVSFLQGLLIDYFIRLTDDSDDLKKLKKLETKLFNLEKDIGKFSLQLHEHIHLIAQVAGQSTAQEEALAARQVQLDALIPELTRNYRTTKKELFAFVGGTIRENKFLAG
jgi:DNA repair ATPase RecN